MLHAVRWSDAAVWAMSAADSSERVSALRAFVDAPVGFLLSKIPYKYEVILFLIAAVTRCVGGSQALGWSWSV